MLNVIAFTLRNSTLRLLNEDLRAKCSVIVDLSVLAYSQ